MYFYSWGDPVNLRQRLVRTCDNRRMTIVLSMYRGTQQGARATKFSMVAPNIRVPLASKLLQVTFLALRNLR
jgi:hypothetical protein